ncbi:MAG: type II secretion system F family protein [Candidatus Nanohaloarchaea archaeon]|nr:type II secretion system F family protein [Candidatus Nanohaloarchaea archaeon]
MGIRTTIRNYLRNHKREALIALVSAVIGLSIVGFNLVNYQNQTTIYTVSEQTASSEFMIIRGDKPFQTTIPIQNPSQLSHIAIKFVFDKANPSSSFTVTLNGQELDSISGMRDGSVQRFTPDVGRFRRANTITIEGEFTVAADARIRSLTVTGHSTVQRITFLLINLFGILITLGPILTIKYYQFTVRAEYEDRFPDFLRDIVEGVRSGMSLPQSIQNASGNDYGRLSKHVNAMAAKLKWGIPFDKVLRDFAEKTDSQIIRRAVNTIIQTYESGGNVSDVLETVGKNIKQIKQLERERESELYGEVITGYLVYFIFLVVLIALIRYLVPALSFSGDIGPLSGSGQSAKALINQYRPVFRNLVVIQAIFSGLVIGKLSEGELRAGAKHVAVLLASGYTAAVLFM